MAEDVYEGARPSFSMRMTIYGISKKFPSVKNITCEQLDLWRRDRQTTVVCLDTRPKEEYDVSHLSGAIQVDPHQEHSLDSLGVNADIIITVVCYCSVGYRSADVAKKLFSAHKRSKDCSSLPNNSRLTPGSERDTSSSSHKELVIYNLEGGLFQWANEGREVVDNRGEIVRMVHPYNSFWGKLLNYDLRYKSLQCEL